MSWRGYGYRGWKAYYAALEIELETREFEPISEVFASPCQKDFIELWLADIGADRVL